MCPLAAYLAVRHYAERASSSASMAVAAAYAGASLGLPVSPLPASGPPGCSRSTTRSAATGARPRALVRGPEGAPCPGRGPGDRCYRVTSLCSPAVEIIEKASRLGIDSTGAASATTVFPSRHCKTIREATLSGLTRQLAIGRFRAISSSASGSWASERTDHPGAPGPLSLGRCHFSHQRVEVHLLPRREPRLPRAGRGQRSSRWRGSTPRVACRTAVRSSCSRTHGGRVVNGLVVAPLMQRRWLARQGRPRDDNSGSSESPNVYAQNWEELQLARRGESARQHLRRDVAGAE